MKPLIDQNVLLDSFLSRAHWKADADAIIRAALNGTIQAMIAPHTLSTIFYIVRKNVDMAAAYKAVDTCIDAFEITALSKTTARQARVLPNQDFEDCLQLACAIEAMADRIVTRNINDFKGSPILVETPEDFVKRLNLP